VTGKRRLLRELSRRPGPRRIGIYLPDRFRQPVVVQTTELSGGGIGCAVFWCGKGIAHYLARFAHVHVLYKLPEIPANAANPEFAVSVT
jgi:hypothetical protein